MRREHRVGVVAVLDRQTEVDLVASGVAEPYRREPRAQRPDRSGPISF
jgi:hypothetical protein